MTTTPIRTETEGHDRPSRVPARADAPAAARQRSREPEQAAQLARVPHRRPPRARRRHRGRSSELSSPAPLLSTPLRQLLPLVVGALVLGRTLRSLRLYRFVRSDRLLDHVGPAGRLVRARDRRGVRHALVLDRRPVVADLLGVGDPRPPRSCWSCTRAGGCSCAAWRAAGWLTPNLVIVGATEYAEQLISDAIARRHVNVLGVFDDRLERAPQAVLGVPVLGDVDALLDAQDHARTSTAS